MAVAQLTCGILVAVVVTVVVAVDDTAVTEYG